MDPLIQGKLLDLLVNIVSIILGSGIILLIIELSRHRRERRAWAREDQLLEIDIPRAELQLTRWQIFAKMSNADKVTIYEHQLEGTIRQLLIAAHFVIRNTTSSEIVVTSYDANVLQIPPGHIRKSFYDLETFDLISVEDIGTIKLQPYAAIARMVILEDNFDEKRKLDTAPSTLVVEAKTSSGATIHGKATLAIVPRLPDIKVGPHEKEYIQYYPKQYLDKLGMRFLEEPPLGFEELEVEEPPPGFEEDEMELPF
jgi:hypothetical protein